MTGRKEQLDASKFGGKTSLAILAKFAREKLSPNASFVFDYLDQQNVIGQPFKWKNQLWRLAPMLAQDVWNTVQYQGPKASPALVGGLGTLGMGVQTYGPKKKKSGGGPGFIPDKLEGGPGFIPDKVSP